MADGIGPYALAFNDAFLKSRALAGHEGEQAFKQGMVLDELRQRGEQGQDIGALTSAFQARRATMANQPPPALGPPPAPAPTEASLGELGINTQGYAPTPAAPAGAPAGEAPRRKSLLEDIDPRAAARLLQTQQGRSAIKDLETAEKEQEQEDNKKLASGVWDVAVKSMKDNDAMGFFDNASKAMRIMGNHDASAKYLEHAMNLRADKDEQQKTSEDLSRWLTAAERDNTEKTPESRAAFMEELGKANSKASRAIQGQLANNALAKTMNQNPQVAGYMRSVAALYRDNMADGKPVDAAKIYRDAAAKDPEGFRAFIYDAMANNKPLPDPVVEKVLGWKKIEAKGPRDLLDLASSTAFERMRHQFPEMRADDPKFMEAWHMETGREYDRLKKKEAEVKKPDDARKELRADRSELRKRLSDVRGELRRLNPEDVAREKDLREEEAQIKADLAEAEKAYSGKSGTPEGKPAEVEIKVSAPPLKLKPTEDKYKLAAKAEIRKLRQAGYTPDQIESMLAKNGWQ